MTKDYFVQKPESRSYSIQGMKIDKLIPIIVLLGIAVLFVFPEPETNFLAYAGTALFFILVIVGLVVWKRKK